MKVSFDFDGTLEMKYMQIYAKELIARGVEVWVVTSRFGDNEKYQKFFKTSINVDITNNDLREITDEVGIPEKQIVFTNIKDKAEYFVKHPDFLWHLDDDWIETDLINNNTKVTGINVFGNRLCIEQAEKIIKRELNK